MRHPGKIDIEEYNYPLPEEKIAQYPLSERDQSKLLILDHGEIREDIFKKIPDYLPSDSLLLFNETRVIHARLVFHKASGSRIEVFCLEPLMPGDIQIVFQQQGRCRWKCFVGNAKRWKGEKLALKALVDGDEVQLVAELVNRVDEAFDVELSWSGNSTFAQIIEIFGKMPLPPYIGREAETSDDDRYQTIFARNDGSVAAPTAGLHFTPDVLERLAGKNIETGKITLHVGAGTFKPVSAATLAEHSMHTEQVIIPVELLEKLLTSLNRPLVLVGTTTVRTIESIYWQGVKWLMKEPEQPYMDIHQWDPYGELEEAGFSVEEALYCVLQVLLRHGYKELKGGTSLMIAPGYHYRFPAAIITNFHQPRSTLLLLVAAFVGSDWMKAYEYALHHDFRFLSYGDSCLFFKGHDH